MLGENSYFLQAEIIQRQTGHTIAVFSTFIGFIMSISGRFVAILYCFIYNIASNFMIKRNAEKNITLNKIIYLWIVAIVPVLGLFGYWYYSSNNVIAIFMWLIIAAFIKKHTVYRPFY